MQAGGELLGQRGIDLALTRNTALTLEGGRDDFDLEMGLATLAPAGMAVMPRGLVLDVKTQWLELPPELAVNPDRHPAH